ncbi:glycoside hydrolase family 36 [Fulvitalea axinellae]|uniref:Glycoside hydrolase family 36 n=1 Tax=Fulvitalea axinellae TaxID=1182444 RepID=A0AAU9D0V7_9BACT|nr:glycoside hydrolase family 36 [Fulvitalea axinellae]
MKIRLFALPVLALALGLLFSCREGKSQPQVPTTVDLSNIDGAKTVTAENFSGKPDSVGVLFQQEIILPKFKRGVYYRPYTWQISGNRVEAVWFETLPDLFAYRPSKPRDLRMKNGTNFQMKYGTFLSLELADGRHMAVLPISGKEALSTFTPKNGKLYLTTANFGTEAVSGNLPLYAVAVAETPHQASNLVWEKALAMKGMENMAKLRHQKKYPEVYSYLGWCSWEHFHKNISQKNMSESLTALKASELPFRWMMVDDGYLHQEGRRLLTFGVDSVKFPTGWDFLTKKKDDKIKWIGIWRNMSGYMSGVSTRHKMKKLEAHLFRYGNRMLSKPNLNSAKAFYEEMALNTAKNGFDFMKVDFQHTNFAMYSGTANAVKASHLNQQALEDAADKNLDGLLNCIAQFSANTFNTRISSVTRNSVDYKPREDKFRHTTAQSFSNALWMSPILWGDMDMFHSGYGPDKISRLASVARSISGGPVYLSDHPGHIKADFVHPIVYLDGKILGTLAPGTPVTESVYTDPFLSGKAYQVTAPLKNRCAALMSMNLNNNPQDVQALIKGEYYANANSMTKQGESSWEIPAEGLLAYDVHEGKARKLNGSFNVSVGQFEDQLTLLLPLRHGRAFIGRTDKYLGPQTYDLVEENAGMMKIRLAESGPVALWSPNKTPSAKGVNFKKGKDGLWTAQLPVKAEERLIEIKFH